MDATTTEVTMAVVINDQWSNTYERYQRESLERWASNHVNALDEAVQTFLDQANRDGGWYSTESPFMYALRWRGEDMAKAEVTTWVAKVIEELFAEDRTVADVLDTINQGLAKMQGEGLHTQSTGLMWNTLATLRGRAASDFSGFSDPRATAHWEAYYETCRELVGPEQQAVKEARQARNEIKSAIGRARSETTLARLQRKLDEAQAVVDERVDELVARLEQVGAGPDVIDSATAEPRF